MTDYVTACPDCGHSVVMHHPSLTRGDGCIGQPNTPDMATMTDIRAGKSCRCPLQPDDFSDGWTEPWRAEL